MNPNCKKKLTEYEKKLDYSLRKESIYHDILLRKIAKLYKLIRILHRDMEILTAKVKMIPGDEEEAKKLENAQIQNAGNSYNDFLEFYTINKIYFSSDVCKMVEALREGYFDSYWDYTAKNRFGFTDFKLNFKNAVAASEKIQKDVKPLLEKLEADVRSTVMGRK